MHYSIDRFEDNIAVLQDDSGNNMDIPRSILPADARQGDVLVLEDGKWQHDTEETASRRERVRLLQEKLLNKKKNDR